MRHKKYIFVRSHGLYVHRLIIFLIFSSLPFISISAADNGYEILTSAIKKIESAPSISAKFTMTEGNSRIEGKVFASGKCFAIVNADGSFETWYDGKTQWTWSQITNEVNITEPTDEELLETDPFAIIKASASGYFAKIKEKSAGMTILSLTPKNTEPTDISNIELQLSDSSNFPLTLKVITKDRQTVIFSFSDVGIGKRILPADFRYKNSYHPGSEIIDLR